MSLKEITKNYTDRVSLAEALKISPRTVSRYEKQGLPCLMIGGRKLYHMDAITKWLKERETQSRAV